MFSFRKPTARSLDAWLRAHAALEAFTAQAEIPARPPQGYRLNTGGALLGHGAEVYRAACDALRTWQMFPHDWVTIVPRDQPPSVGQTVAVVARCFGLWTVHGCRVIDVSELATADESCFGVTYATLSDHNLRGAERFAIRWQRATDEVRYELASYSRPRTLLARLAAPYIKLLQSRFAGDSPRALAAAVEHRLAETNRAASSQPTCATEEKAPP